MNNSVRRLAIKPPREAIALAAVSTLGIAAVLAVYATWRFAKLVP
jgi:hypothetical protein